MEITWKQFKDTVESKGMKDEDKICFIDISWDFTDIIMVKKSSDGTVEVYN